MPLLVLGALAYLVYAFFASAWPFDSGLLPLSKYESVDVNVYFYFPDNREVFLGQTHGAAACGNAARQYASSKGAMNSRWSYVCCTIRKDSQCYEKIR